MSRVVVTLREDEHDALIKLSLDELRTPRDQARHILRCELERLGLLKFPDVCGDAEPSKSQERRAA